MNEERLLHSLEWWHVVGGLASMAVALFGIGFRQWSRTLEGVTKQWTEKLEQFANRQERHEKRLEDNVKLLHRAHLRIIDRISRVEGQLAARAGGKRWYDPSDREDED